MSPPRPEAEVSFWQGFFFFFPATEPANTQEQCIPGGVPPSVQKGDLSPCQDGFEEAFRSLIMCFM